MQTWIPRLEPAEMKPQLADYLAGRVRRLGYLGEMFKVGANVPDVLLSFMHFTDALKDSLPFDIGEVVVLTVASVMGNAYERNQHERLCVRSGLDRTWITEVQRLKPASSQIMTPAQRATQQYVLRALETQGHEAEESFAALAEHFTPAQAMAIAFLAGRYVTHAFIVNTMKLKPPVPSIFEDGFAG